jgi:hypothetical protein
LPILGSRVVNGSPLRPDVLGVAAAINTDRRARMQRFVDEVADMRQDGISCRRHGV